MRINILHFNTDADVRRLRQLVHRFEAGETSRADEHRLFARFASGKSLPPDLEPLRPMMQWYATMEGRASSTKARRYRTGLIRSTVAIAASVAVVTTIAVGVMRHDATAESDSRRGSYVVSGGVRNTNLAAITPALDRAESTVKASHSLSRRMPDAVDMSDPMVRKAVERCYQDEYDAEYYTSQYLNRR